MGGQNPDSNELASALPFDRLSSEERESIRKRLTVHDIQPGRFLLKRDTEGTEMYFLVHGSLKVSTFYAEKEAILAILRPGEVVGDITLLCGGVRSADVVALSPCRLYRCAKEDFEAHLTQFGGLAYLLLQNLARRVRAASLKISDLSLYDVTCRVARTLCEMSITGEMDGSPTQIVNDPPTHQALASMIGSSREAVTRALKELERAHHILVEDETIFIFSLPE